MPPSSETGGVGPGDAHFVVLPDCEDALAAARSFPRPPSRTLDHASGRPWLIGRWSEKEIVTARAGRTAIAVVGCCPVGPAELERHAARIRDLADLDGLARELSGSFHLVAALDGRLRVQGTASGLRLVFHASVGGVEVAATRADVLAAAIGSEPDEEQLATRLLWPVPYPLFESSLWRGVTAVPPEEALIIAPDGRTARRSRWWTPPEPTRSLAEGAPRVRQALSEAVDARTRDGGVVSCDLSGGLDSTSVCFLAAASPAHVVASTWPGRDPADSDLYWAEKAAGFLPDVEHVVWDADESPLVYTGLLTIDDLMDEPTIGVMDRARVLHHLPGLAERGSRLHLTGIGGDHVAWCSEAYYHRLIRTRPLLALRQLRGFKTLFQWPLGDTARVLADSRPYGQWLAASSRRLRDPLPPPVDGALGWGSSPRLFDWVTPEAAHAVGRALRDTAARAEPLHPDRGLHADLEQVRICTRIVRQWDGMAARAGVPMASPFFDDRVIEECLAVDPAERVTPWAYKPLLAAAMRGVVPDACLRRSNKAHASMDASNGLREHRGDLMELWEGSHLDRMGLVDGGALRTLAQRPSTPGLKEAILYSTIACEVWLRNLPQHQEKALST
ncbi:lasso peptide isopeptide bond-forming cyclase [Streptomyces griseocarneus]|uniref:lasso peptide isopeptide bond-forming cyclase n=1 Tax=Streptomyces griseocarneus TaxID=51201 RepID=UPI00167E6301|nr:lasso peptide isopeptide bond-forming cyclase [Streptomyces griseocarneus]MBZ6477900.1 lasso peptide isopeptide bond-forming cyclase [Streptomyces griseocarneus]GHG54344.1 asparagine synthase [Streptomyces griseocarneus]